MRYTLKYIVEFVEVTLAVDSNTPEEAERRLKRTIAKMLKDFPVGMLFAEIMPLIPAPGTIGGFQWPGNTGGLQWQGNVYTTPQGGNIQTSGASSNIGIHLTCGPGVTLTNSGSNLSGPSMLVNGHFSFTIGMSAPE
jgi:hypothetical protein